MPDSTSHSDRGASVGPKLDGGHVADVYARLRTAILQGVLREGAPLPVSQLSRSFGAGRTPLREAMRLLEREGLIVAAPNRSVRVASLSVDDFEELCILRITLEAVSVRVTVPGLRSDDFAELEGYMAKMEHYAQNDDAVGLRVPHRAFHHRLVAGAGRRISVQTGELADHSERYRVRFGGMSAWSDRRAEHRAILEAAKAGDPDRTAECLSVHYARTAALLFAALDPGRDLTRLRSVIRTVAPGAEAALDANEPSGADAHPGRLP